VFDAVVDRTRSRLDVPKLRTIFADGAASPPHPQKFLRNRGRDRDTCV